MSDSDPISQATNAKWAHMEDKSVTALRAGWSVGAIQRAYGVPFRVVRDWRTKHKIPAATSGNGRPTPEVGQLLK